MKFFFALLVVTLFGNEASAQELRTFTINGLYGYKRGNAVAIPAKYSYAADFKDGRAAVFINKKWGFIDTKGKLVIPNEYERVETFTNGFARFYVGNKIGLLDSMGKKVVPAYCDEIEIYQYAEEIYLESGKNKGLYIIKEKTLIEPKYNGVRTFSSFVYAETGDHRFDVYTIKGKLLGQNITVKSMLLDEDVYSEKCDLSWRDSMCFVDKEGNKISQTYTAISKNFCDITKRENDYSSDFHYYTIYLLHLPGNNEFIDPEGNSYSNKFHLLYGDHFITDGEYSDYSNEENLTLVKKNEFYYKIEKNGDFLLAKYVRSEQANQYTLLYYPDRSADVVKINRAVKMYQYDSSREITKEPEPDTTFVAHFKSARVMYENYVDYEYNPDYDEIRTLGISQYVPFNAIEVEGENENAGKWALYDLETGKYCSKFDDHTKILNYKNGKTVCYVFMDQESRLMAYSLGDFQSDYEFWSMSLTLGGKSVFLTREDSTSVMVLGKELKKVDFPGNVELVNSSYITTGIESVFSEVTGEYESTGYPQEVFPFLFDVFETLSEPRKYGFLDENDRVILPQYDQLIAIGDSTLSYCSVPVIGTRQGDLYGFYNLRSAVEVKPQFKNPLKFQYDPILKLMYTQPDDQHYYLTDSGKKVYSINQSPEIFTENKKKGLFVVNDFNQQAEEHQNILPAAFRSFTFFDDLPYAVAENQLKRKGLINYVGDTLIPFEFDKIEQGNFSRFAFPSDPYIVVRSDDKMGLYFANKPNMPVAKYDRIDSLSISVYNTNTFITASDNKFGLLNNEAVEVLPCSYSGVDVVEEYEVIKAIALEPDQVKIFRYIENGSIDTVMDVLQVDFVIGTTGYRKTEGGYFVFDIFANVFVEFVEELNQPVPGTSCEVFEENGLLGFRDLTTKKIVLSPTLRYAKFNETGEYLGFKNGIRSYQPVGKKAKKKNK